MLMLSDSYSTKVQKYIKDTKGIITFLTLLYTLHFKKCIHKNKTTKVYFFM